MSVARGSRRRSGATTPTSRRRDACASARAPATRCSSGTTSPRPTIRCRAEIHELARSCANDGLVSGQLAFDGDLGFVILHRCGESFYFLIFSTWRNENELWETVWAKNGENDPVFHQWPREGTHCPAFCVWELGAVCHERVAWSDYLRSDRDVAAREAYLADTFSGEV